MAAARKPANAGQKQGGGRFQPGQSGNPAGKRPGTRAAATLLAEKLMQEDLPKIVEAVIKAAGEGDMTAARIVLDRVAPIRRGRIIEVKVPAITDADSIGKAFNAVFETLASGTITIEEARSLAELIEIRGRAIPVKAPDEHAEFKDAKANLLEKLEKMHQRYLANIERQKALDEQGANNTNTEGEDTSGDADNDGFGEHSLN
jgi:hypothetical protein